MTRTMRSISGLLILIVAGSGHAQPPASTNGGKSLIDAVSACRNIMVRDERLACFDRAAAALDVARADNGLVIMDKADIREKRRSLFGFQLPKIDIFGGKDSDQAEPEFSELTSSILSVSRSGRDNYTLRLADKSVWRTTEPSKMAPERNDKIRIKSAAMGSYRANIAGATAVRIQRVE